MSSLLSVALVSVEVIDVATNEKGNVVIVDVEEIVDLELVCEVGVPDVVNVDKDVINDFVRDAALVVKFDLEIVVIVLHRFVSVGLVLILLFFAFDFCILVAAIVEDDVDDDVDDEDDDVTDDDDDVAVVDGVTYNNNKNN